MRETTLRLTLALLMALTTACTALVRREYPVGEIPLPDAEHRIVAVTRTSGDVVAFDQETDDDPVPRPFVADQAIVGPVGGQRVRVDLSETSSVSFEERAVQPGRTGLLVLVVGFGALYGLALLTFDVGL